MKEKRIFDMSNNNAVKMMHLFVEGLKAGNYKYTADESKASVSLVYDADNFKGLSFRFFFDDTGKSVGLRVYSIFQFTNNQLPDAYEFCNAMNAKWRWVRFYVDDDRELTADLDAYITEESVAAECINLLGRAVNIVDDVIGEMKS
jgi:hypothetical protein